MVIALSISSSAALSSIAVATATTHSSALQAERNIQRHYHSYQLDTTLEANYEIHKTLEKVGCMGCEERCPFGVPVAVQMKKAEALFA